MISYEPLKTGDEIRIIAPSSSWQPAREAVNRRAIQRLEDLGYKVSLGKHITEAGRFGTATIAARLADLHDAYKAPAVKAVLCVCGGWSANELLSGIDWQLLKANPKPLIGFSDITVLLNAICAKTGQIGLLGPNLGSFGGNDYWQYSLENLQMVLTKEQSELPRSHGWRSGRNHFKTTPAWKTIQPGAANGTLIGGNVGTYYLLQGTAYAPKLTGDIIVAVEDDDEAGPATARELDRRLESLLQQPGARKAIKGVLVGRFQKTSRVTMPDIIAIVKQKFDVSVPVVANVDFGHSKPLLTLPIGGRISLDATGKRPVIKLIKY